MKHVWKAPDVRRRVSELGAEYERDFTNREWLVSFSGKEIFRHLRAEVPGLDSRAGRGSASQRDEDLARKMARAMRGTRSATVTFLGQLRAALRARAGLRP